MPPSLGRNSPLVGWFCKVRTGKIRVHEVWCAVDPGVALQPKNIEAQMESAIIFGISMAQTLFPVRRSIPERNTT